MIWSKIGLQEVMGSNVQGICPTCSSEEDWSHIMKEQTFGRTRFWTRLRNINAEMDTRRMI
jgi:hypothetical protein